MTRPFRLAVPLAALLIVLATPTIADEIFGSVQEANGSPVAFAEIRACRDGNANRCETTVTDGRGRYTIMGLSAGRYTIFVRDEAAEDLSVSGNTRLDLIAN